MLIIGSESSAAEMTACLERAPATGYRVVSICVPGGLRAAVVVRLDNPGPSFYRSERMGLAGTPSPCSSSAA